MVAAAPRMPMLFVGHGSPMNALEDNEFSQAWHDMGQAIPRPQAILCVSAHWETNGTRVTAQEKPKTIHDFYGFPPALYRMQYPAPGSPETARRVIDVLPDVKVQPDSQWGLDHGAWSVLARMFPKADIPTVQLSLDRTKPPEYHFELGRRLWALRDEGVLLLGSGNIVHNLSMLEMNETGYDWACAFDEEIRNLVEARDFMTVANYRSLGRTAALAVPTNEHFLPLLYVLGAASAGDPISFFCEKCVMGSISMRGVRVG